ALGGVRGLPGRHRNGREPTGGERLPEVGAELGRVPAHEPARLAGAGDSGHDLRHLRERRHAVKDAADLLELATEALERLRPALRELGPDRLGFLARVLGPSGWRRGEEAARLAHLGADPRHELLPRGHGGGSLASPFHRSWKVRGATAGRSRVRVQSPKKRGRLRIPPARTKGRLSTRAHRAPSGEACASSFTEAGPLSIAVSRIPMGPG